MKEEIDDYVDIYKTNELIDTLDCFVRQENYYSAPLFLAQRIILQSGLALKGFLSTENGWVEGTSNEEFGEFVLPPIDVSEFKVE